MWLSTTKTMSDQSEIYGPKVRIASFGLKIGKSTGPSYCNDRRGTSKEQRRLIPNLEIKDSLKICLKSYKHEVGVL